VCALLCAIRSSRLALCSRRTLPLFMPLCVCLCGLPSSHLNVRSPLISRGQVSRGHREAALVCSPTQSPRHDVRPFTAAAHHSFTPASGTPPSDDDAFLPPAPSVCERCVEVHERALAALRPVALFRPRADGTLPRSLAAERDEAAAGRTAGGVGLSLSGAAGLGPPPPALTPGLWLPAPGAGDGPRLLLWLLLAGACLAGTAGTLLAGLAAAGAAAGAVPPERMRSCWLGMPLLKRDERSTRLEPV